MKNSVDDTAKAPYKVIYFLPYFLTKGIETKEDSQYHIISKEGTIDFKDGSTLETQSLPYDIAIFIPEKGHKNE